MNDRNRGRAVKLFGFCSVALLYTLHVRAVAADPGRPHLERHGTAQQLVVDGKPFLVLGGELHNSSGSSVDYMQPIWPRLAAMHLNTVIAPVSWELTEPTEGTFTFDVLDGLLDGARANHLHLVLLWFGSWKNGLSSYPPVWVKQDPARFPPAQDAKGTPLDILSTFGPATAAADARAFAAVLAHLRQVDMHHTVLAIQVENEVGMRGDSRDRSPAANAAFDAPVPDPVLHLLSAGGDHVVPELLARWNAAGHATAGNWTQVFGPGIATDEIFMAWQYARFVDSVAAAGKKQYPIPLYANCWLDQPGTPNPGDYPSGGPLAHVMSLWQLGAPSLDFVSPDLYVPEFEHRCDLFTRCGNPLFIPETNTGDRAGANALLAFGKYDAIGFSPFGIDGFRRTFGDGIPTELADPDSNSLSQTYAALETIKPIILDVQGSGRMTAVMIGPGSNDESAMQKAVHLAGYTITVKPRRPGRRSAATSEPTTAATQPTSTASALFVNVGPDEFLMLTTGLDVAFQKDGAPGRTTVASIDEGGYVDGKWVRGRRLNGDQTDHNREPSRAMQPYRLFRVRLFQRATGGAPQ